MSLAEEPFATFADVSEVYAGSLSESDWGRVEGHIRRAARSLAGLVGDLRTHDADLVRDTIVDAVMRRLDNPRGFASETDGDYSYRYFKGSDGWAWPSDWADLFAVTRTVGSSLSPKSTRVTSQWAGWGR